jgi:TIR domain
VPPGRGPSTERQNEPVDPGDEIWEPNKLRLFISHSSNHRHEVGGQKFGLATLGVDAFVAHEDIEPSLEWQGVIELALATCDAMVVWVTPDLPQSDWTDQEVGFCIGQRTLIIPVRLGRDPYGFIAKYQGLQGLGKEPFAISKEIVEILAKNGSTASRYRGPAAYAFAGAGSYEMARTTYKMLTLLPIDGWDGEILNMLEEAPARNDQLENGIYETQRLPDLLREFVAARRPHVRPAPSPAAATPSIECRAEVEQIDGVLDVNGRTFRNNQSIWLYVKNLGPTAEFSVRFWNVQGVPPNWGTNYGVRHALWEGGRPTTRPEIDGYGGERRVKVANVSLDPFAFWFYTTENGSEECGNQLLLSELYPTFVGHNISFDVEIVNQATGEKLLKDGWVTIVPSVGYPTFTLRDS